MGRKVALEQGLVQRGTSNGLDEVDVRSGATYR